MLLHRRRIGKFYMYFDYDNKKQQIVLEDFFEQWLNHLQKLLEQI